MPSVPGFFPVAIVIQAGMVIGGWLLSIRACTPLSSISLMFGSWWRNCLKSSWGGAQSSPITSIRFWFIVCAPR